VDPRYLGGSALGLSGWVGDAGGTFGLVFGVFAGFEEGGGTSGDAFGTDGDVGGDGMCCVQPAAMAPNAMVMRVDLVRFILHSSNG
jgi:hypothetical protein